MNRSGLWLIPLTVLVTTPALAVPPTTTPTAENAGAARALFEDGLKLKKAGKIQEALDRFQRSSELVPSVGALVQIGECYKLLDRPASAWGAFHEADSLAMRIKDPRQPDVEKLAAELLPKLAHLKLNVPKIEGLTVTRNGIKVDPATFDTELPIDHGSYSVEATAPGRKRWSGKLDIAPSTKATLTIPNLEIVTNETTGPSGPPSPPKNDDTDLQRTVGIGLEIGGGALLAVGLVFGGLTFASWGAVTDKCEDGKCPTRAEKSATQSDADRASTFGVVSTLGVVVGAAALAGGVVLHLTAPRKSVAIAPAMGTNTYGLTLTFRQ